MVIGRLLFGGGNGGQGDPFAKAKTLAVIAGLYLVFSMLPEATQRSWIDYANTTEGMRTLWISVLVVILILSVVVQLGVTSAWQRMRFEQDPKTRPEHAGVLIWLHGVGDSGMGFEWLRRELAASFGLAQLKVVLPDAPMRALIAAGGSKKRAWFGVHQMPISSAEPDDVSEDGLAASVAAVLELVEAQVAEGLPASKIMLGGFSQGAAVAAWAAAECKHKLGAVVLWSGYAPRRAALEQKLADAASGRGVPFVACHGDADDKVKLECGTQLMDALAAAGVKLRTRKVYEGLKHGCTREQLEQLAALIAEVAPPKQGGKGSDAAAKKRD